MKKNRSIASKGAALLGLFVLLMGAGAVLLDAGVCQNALFRCVNDPTMMAFPTGGAYCLNGYVFCLKYVAPPQ